VSRAKRVASLICREKDHRRNRRLRRRAQQGARRPTPARLQAAQQGARSSSQRRVKSSSFVVKDTRDLTFRTLFAPPPYRRYGSSSIQRIRTHVERHLGPRLWLTRCGRRLRNLYVWAFVRSFRCTSVASFFSLSLFPFRVLNDDGKHSGPSPRQGTRNPSTQERPGLWPTRS
jgi:hypothetical protein